MRSFLLPAAAVCLFCKLYLGWQLDLYSDEIFYWLASTKPAIAYSDLPFVTALLAGLGNGLSPGNPIAVRSLFILIGSLLPLSLYWTALPIVGHRKALETALYSLCLPLGGFLGLLAVPDVPLLFFGVLSLGLFERALRTDNTGFWLLTALVVALGFSTHYRFVMYPVSAVLFLALCKEQHHQWKNPKLWLTIVLASLGLAPIVWFNLQHDLSSASFYFFDRHPWQFQVSGLFHIFKQAGLVTPPLYVLLIMTLVRLFKKSRQGDNNAMLLFCFSSSHLFIYFVLAPWSDSNSTSIHWPLSGYFPLLIALPETIRQVTSTLDQKRRGTTFKKLIVAIPFVGFLGTVAAFIGIGSQAFQEPLQRVLPADLLSNKMAGWKEFELALKNKLTEFKEPPTLVTDNYYTAAQIEFANLSKQVFTIDESKAVRDGRITQLQLWQKDVAGLLSANPTDILFITEDSTLNVETKHEALKRACAISSSLKYDRKIELFNGAKQFSFYTGKMNSQEEAAQLCPYPARAWVDTPAPDSPTGKMLAVSGWAFNQDIGIETIHVLINGQQHATADYGLTRQDVADSFLNQTLSDPNSSSLGFQTVINTENLPDGAIVLELEVVAKNGETSRHGKRQITVSH